MILDGHNDLLLRLWLGEEPRHIDLARARAAGFGGGFFAVFVPAGPPPPDPTAVPYALPLPDPIDRDAARQAASAIADIADRLEADGVIRLARSVDDFAEGEIAAILHLEGAEPLAPDLSDLDEWYARGLRSLGLVWSRPNAFGEGVPFAHPGSPDTGPGLTAAGRALVTGCNERGILVDCSHLNRRGFFDVAGISEAPLVATHSNAHALCPSTRNLEDDQLDAIGDTGGVVGVNFAVSFLREDGWNDPDTPLETICRHVEYLAERIGIDHVAFGSDFEGAVVPNAVGGVEGLPNVVEALRERGFDDEALAKVTHLNWLRVLRETWKG